VGRVKAFGDGLGVQNRSRVNESLSLTDYVFPPKIEHREGSRFEQALDFYRRRGSKIDVGGRHRINAAVFVRVECAHSH